MAALERQRGRRVVLLTLSVRHSGDIEADHGALKAGWRALYKAMHRRGWGRFPYVGVVEVTPGRDGRGHVHAHVVAIWPWRDWSVVAKLWRRACPESTRISLVAAKSPRGACRYVSKYISKGMQGSEFTPELRARVVAGMYGARWVFTSWRFWQPFEPCCPTCCTRVQLVVVHVRDAWLRGRPPDWRPEWWCESDELVRAWRDRWAARISARDGADTAPGHAASVER